MNDLPQDTAVERASLAGLYRHGWNAFIDVDGILVEEAYTDAFYRCLYRCFKHIFEQNQDAKPDLALIEVAAKTLGCEKTLYTPDNVKLLRGISLMPVERENLRPLAEQVRRLHVIRGLRGKLLDVAERYKTFTGTESLDEIVSRAESAVFDYEHELAGETDDVGGYGDFAPELVEHVIAHPVECVGYETGFPEFDRAVGGGPRPGGINVIACRTKGGKSFIADKMAIHTARNGIASCVVDTEMERDKRVPRALAMLSGVHIKDIETGKFRSDADRQAVRRAAAELKKLGVGYKSIVGRPFDEVLSVLRRWVVKRVGLDPVTRKAKPCILFFDWFQLADTKQLGKVGEHQAIGFQMKQLLAFLIRYGVACVAFVQMNREGITDETSAVVAQSDRIAQFCDSLSLYKWKDPEDLAAEYAKPKGQPRYTHKLIAAVNGTARYGPGLDPLDYIHVETNYGHGLIREGPLNSRLEDTDPSKAVSGGEDVQPQATLDFS